MKLLRNLTAVTVAAVLLAGSMLTLTGCGQTVPGETKPAPQQTQAPTTTTGQEKKDPVLTTKVLDLAGLKLSEVSAVLGDYTQSDGFYWFDGGYVGYVFANGTDAGNNYIQAPLDRLITNCPEKLSVKDLQNLFPGGKTEYDEMDEKNCFCWDYRDCTVVIFENADGTYTADSLFYYNCQSMVQQATDARVNGEIFQILGKTKSQMDAFFGQQGVYDGQFCCMTYSYKDSYVWAYMDDYEKGTCIGFYCPLNNVINMTAPVDAEELKEIFGETYQDPWNGDTGYSTMYKGGQLRILQTYGDTPGSFSSNAVVNFCLAGKQFFPVEGEEFWANSSSLFYGNVAVYSLTDTELVCKFSYGQMTPPNRIAETGQVKLTSTDGITYTATGVEDNWGSVLTVTVTMLEEAAQIRFTVTKAGEMANFCFGDYVAYQ